MVHCQFHHADRLKFVVPPDSVGSDVDWHNVGREDILIGEIYCVEPDIRGPVWWSCRGQSEPSHAIFHTQESAEVKIWHCWDICSHLYRKDIDDRLRPLSLLVLGLRCIRLGFADFARPAHYLRNLVATASNSCLIHVLKNGRWWRGLVEPRADPKLIQI